MAGFVDEKAVESPPKRAVNVADFSVPNIVFDNRTPYAAAQFDTIDQHDAAFHVFVAKIGYTLGECDANGLAKLVLLDSPAQLNTQDKHVGDDFSASLIEESDFAPHKPRCDVIVNAVAHAPRGEPTRQFDVRLGVASEKSVRSQPDDLVDKTLTVCGERFLEKKAFARRLLESPLKIASLGLTSPNPWRLTIPETLKQLPLRYEFAQGGQCRIDSGDPAAMRVDRKHPLLGKPVGQPREKAEAIAHEVCETNPVGLGFTREWFLAASKSGRLPAPQITSDALPFSAATFWRGAQGTPLPSPAGLGAVGRAWTPRRALVGKIEEKTNWSDNEIPRLPLDFDYAYWNSAPFDQQCDYLNGQERITLVNLCSADSPCASVDQHGNTVLRFVLPRQAMFVLAVNHANTMLVMPLSLDTVTINPETRRLDLVWRGCIDADGSHVATRLMHITQADQIERLNMLVELQWSTTAPPEAKGE